MPMELRFAMIIVGGIAGAVVCSYQFYLVALPTMAPASAMARIYEVFKVTGLAGAMLGATTVYAVILSRAKDFKRARQVSIIGGGVITAFAVITALLQSAHLGIVAAFALVIEMCVYFSLPLLWAGVLLLWGMLSLMRSRCSTSAHRADLDDEIRASNDHLDAPSTS